VDGANLEILIAIIGATIGALLGSLSSILFGLVVSQRQEKKDMVIQLYEEYNSVEMRQNRALTSDFFGKRPAGIGYHEYRTAFSNPGTQRVEEVTREQFEGFRNLMSFFEKVYMLKEHGYLSRKLAAGLLGIYVCGWARNGWLDFLRDSGSGPGSTSSFTNSISRNCVTGLSVTITANGER
jgi:hypothetical protein